MSHPLLPATAPTTVARLSVSKSQCTRANQAKVAAGRLMANACKRRSRIKGSTRNSPIAKTTHKPTIACIHQYAGELNLNQRSAASIM